MSTLKEYYDDLLKWEGVSAKVLVSKWNQIECQSIVNEFKQALASSGLIGDIVPIRFGSTNQSIGNQVEEYFIQSISPHLRDFTINTCVGFGYPDRILKANNTGKQYPLEFKATSDWNPSDSNRRVLTSSSRKLRNLFSEPINHLLATVIYDKSNNPCRIEKLRLDFLEPDTEVNVRLEASVNHRMLSDGQHFFVML